VIDDHRRSIVKIWCNVSRAGSGDNGHECIGRCLPTSDRISQQIADHALNVPQRIALTDNIAIRWLPEHIRIGGILGRAKFPVQPDDPYPPLQHALRLHPAQRAVVDLRRQLAQDTEIVAGLEPVGSYQRAALDLCSMRTLVPPPSGTQD
jgi:hypothetical protein